MRLVMLTDGHEHAQRGPHPAPHNHHKARAAWYQARCVSKLHSRPPPPGTSSFLCYLHTSLKINPQSLLSSYYVLGGTGDTKIKVVQPLQKLRRGGGTECTKVTPSVRSSVLSVQDTEHTSSVRGSQRRDSLDSPRTSWRRRHSAGHWRMRRIWRFTSLCEDEIQRGGRIQPEEKQPMLVGGKPHYHKDG